MSIYVATQGNKYTIWSELFAPQQVRVRVEELTNVDVDNKLLLQNVVASALVIIDIEERIEEGILLCTRLSDKTPAPILFMVLGDECNERQQLKIYESGAADVLLKPFSPQLLYVKVQAWLRHTRPFTSPENIATGLLHLDSGHRRLLYRHEAAEVSIALTATEYRLLQLLMNHPHQTLSTERILQRVWQFGDGSTSALRSTIHRLRKKLRPYLNADELIAYINGEGYQFNPPLLQQEDELQQQSAEQD